MCVFLRKCLCVRSCCAKGPVAGCRSQQASETLTNFCFIMEINELSRGQGEDRTGEESKGERGYEKERESEGCAASAKAVLVTDCPLGVDGRELLNQGQVGRLGPDTGNCSGEAAWNKSPIPGQHQAQEQGRTKPWRHVQMGREREGVLARIIKKCPQEHHKRERRPDVQ